MGFFRKIGNAFARFMYGRNGVDQLNRALLWVYIALWILSIVLGMLIPPTFAGINPTLYTVIRAAIKLLLIPVTMGIGYELLKFAGKHENIVTRIISAPGMWLQRITVKEPTDDMIECAIKAFIAVLPDEEKEAEIAAADVDAQNSEK